jgi:hypothetical protein
MKNLKTFILTGATLAVLVTAVPRKAHADGVSTVIAVVEIVITKYVDLASPKLDTPPPPPPPPSK